MAFMAGANAVFTVRPRSLSFPWLDAFFDSHRMHV